MKKKNILSIYKKIVLSRVVDEKIINQYPNSLMRCPVHLSIGQEGVGAGVSAALKTNDIVMSNHRSHSHYISKNCDIKKMIFEIFLKKDGCCGGKGGSMHLVDLKKNFYGSTPIVASTIPIATGISFGSKILNYRNEICVIYFGDGAFESGNFHECLNFSALHKLKILFVCENNKYSVYSHLKLRQNKNLKIHKVAKQYGIKSFKGDGNKPDDVYSITSKSRRMIIKNSMPILLEFDTYRYYEHCGPNDDDHLNYRNPREVKYWKKKFPMIYMQKKYKKFSNSFREINQNAEKKISKIFLEAKNSKLPVLSELNKNIYA